MTYRICSKCQTRPAQDGQSYCKECHAEYMKEWRSKAISIRLDDDTYEWVRRRSGRRHQSVSAIVADALKLLKETDDQVIARGITRLVQGSQQPPDAAERRA